MERKTITLFALIVFLCGCTTTPIIKTETQKVLVPVLYVPAPAAIERPVLPIDQMTPEQMLDEGEVAKHYKATVKTLEDYASDLERVIQHYAQLAKDSEETKKQVEETINNTSNPP